MHDTSSRQPLLFSVGFHDEAVFRGDVYLSSHRQLVILGRSLAVFKVLQLLSTTALIELELTEREGR